ncbi:restriction endonuclease subunit S [Rhodanobacter sp. 115]|uniref:restriction endonuclease subunit S n=1 Tax=Rhodanobacter sp. FW021-MT20 TaxID=1162282 RepID=UPI0034E606B5
MTGKRAFDGETAELESLCAAITDCHHSTPNWTDAGWIVVRSENIKNGKISLDSPSYTDEASFRERIARSVPQPGDLIITREAPMGEIGMIPDGVTCCLGQRQVLIKPDAAKVDKHYLLYAMQSHFVQMQIGASNATGSTVSNLRIPLLKELAIPLIGDKLTQGKIAAVLSALDAKIDLNHRINAELEALAKTIYDYWFVQFDFPDAHGRPYKSSGGAMVWNDTLKREIPAGWGDALLGNIVDILDSKRVPLSKQQRESRPGSIPYYGATGIFGFIDDFLFDEELLLLAEDGSVMDDRGKVVLQRIWGKSWVNNHAHVLRPRNGWTVDLLYLMLRETPAIQMMSGSIQKKITQENLNAARILVAPDPIRRSLTSVLVVLRDRQKLAIEESAELTLLRDWLLPLLMNGQVRVA